MEQDRLPGPRWDMDAPLPPAPELATAIELTIERLGLEPAGVLRIGLTHYNTQREVDRLLDELRTILGQAA